MAERTTNGDSPETPASKGKSSRFILIGFISVIMLLETALFFFLVPSAEEVSALAEARLVRDLQANEKDATQAMSDENQPKEFDLGSFGETFRPIDSENKFRVEFRLFGLVRTKDYARMEAEFKAKEGRLRHAIRAKVRNSELSELEENQLGLLQRRLLATCNHLLESELLVSIGFADYQLFAE